MWTLNPRVQRLFRDQHGLVSRAQAREAGVSESAIQRRLSSGEWLVAAPGVYRLPSAKPTFWHRAAAVCLQGAPHTAVSHGTAAYFYELDGFNRWAPKVIQVSIPEDERLRPPSGVEVFRARRHSPQYFRHRIGVAVTSPQRTLVDLAGFLDEAKLDVTVDSALRKYPELEAVLLKVVNGLDDRAYPGLSTLRELLHDRQVTDSALEVEVRRLSWAAGLPKPEIHFNVCHRDRWIGEVDFAWVDAKVCIPAHSLLFHTRSKQFYRDQEQTSELIAAGWHPLPTTKRDVLRTPGRFIERLRETYERALQRRLHEPPGEGEPARW